MKRSFASLLVVIFALCTVPIFSAADAAAPPIQYAEDHELTPYAFESIQDIQITMNRYVDASKQNVSKAAQVLENMLFSGMKIKGLYNKSWGRPQKRKTNDSQTDKVSLTRKHTGGESLVRKRVYNRTAEIGRCPD